MYTLQLLALLVTVRDPSNLPLPHAQLTLKNLQTGARSAATGCPCHLADLAPGTYELTVHHPGFVALTKQIEIRPGERPELNLTLALNPNKQALQVTATFDRDKIATLPLDGRNFIPLIALAPGINLPPGSLLPRINGGRPRVNEYIYDGISVLLPEPGQVAFYPIIDAIEEFRVETNSFAAEFGRANGGIIIVNQKTGTNDWHGTAFEFFRNEALNARNLFAADGPKPDFRRNQFGAVLGGPIRRNKTFIFADWQSTRLRIGQVRISTVPTLQQREGRQVGFPLPTSDAAANNYRRVVNDTTVANQGGVRLDHYFNPEHRVFGRFTRLGDMTEPAAALPEGANTTRTNATGIAAEYTWIPTPSTVNQLRFGRTGRSAKRRSQPLPVYEIAGFQTLGPPAGSNGDFQTSVTQFIDTFTWTRGAHTAKAGADIRHEALDVLQPPYPNGNFQFTSFAAFLAGRVNRYTIDIQPEPVQARANVAEFFVQDDWRATRKLSVSGGVRYTLNFPSTLVNDRGALFNLNTQQLDFPHTARDLEKLNFAPRLGLAYRLNDGIALRAGYGLTWIEQAGITTPFTIPLFPFIQTLIQQAPDNTQPAFLLANGPTVQPRPAGPDAGLGQGVFAVQRDNGSGYAQQWNFSIQRKYSQNWNFETGYLGSKLTRLGVPDVNINQLTVEQVQRGDTQRPYPRFNTVALYRNNIGHSTYHSLQTRIEKRMANGLQFTAAYTFSKLIDDAGAVFDSAILSGPVTNFQAADSYNKRLEKDVSTGNMPHIFSAGFVYDLPKRWRLGGLVRAQSGMPMAITQAVNLNAFAGFGIQRPNRVASPKLPAEQRSVAKYFNTAAFTQAAARTIGNSSRNPVSGPGYRTVDLMVGKTFPLRERARLEFRAEAFNVTNTPPLGNPNGSFGQPSFGSITTALDPRVFELVLKAHF